MRAKEPLVLEHTRGPLVESRHFIHAMWVDENAEVVESWGNTEMLICPRSSFKPFQVLPYVLSKAYEKSPEAGASIALAMASHAAEVVHTSFVEKWLAKLGLGESDLVCGPQWPRLPERIWEMAQTGQRFSRLFNNCSGKHTGMLATCQCDGHPTRGYHQWDHPLQKQIRDIAGKLGGLDMDKAPYGTDGCGLPIYYLPMSSFAKMGAAYLDPDKSEFGEALKQVRKAWRENSLMVGGTLTLDTRLTEVTNGRLIAKIGAQGNYICLDLEKGRCLVFKIDSGSEVAREQALMDFLCEGGHLAPLEEKELRRLVTREIVNWEGKAVGEARLRFPSDLA